MTSGWDIDTAGTQGVLRKTAANVDDQNEFAKRLGTAVDDAGAVLGRGLVGKALADYVDASLLPNLTSIAERSGRIVEGAHEALVAYVRADSVMAQQSQASALAAGAVDDDGGLASFRGSGPDGGLASFRGSGPDGGGPISWLGGRSPERG